MKKTALASLALLGALVLSGCAATYPSQPAPAPASASTVAPDPEQPAGSHANPIAVSTDGATSIDANNLDHEVYVTAPANASFEVTAGESVLYRSDDSDGLRVEETERGLRVTVLDDQEPQYLVAYDSNSIEHWLFINGNGGN